MYMLVLKSDSSNTYYYILETIEQTVAKIEEFAETLNAEVQKQDDSYILLQMPMFRYHCHIIPLELFDNRAAQLKAIRILMHEDLEKLTKWVVEFTGRTYAEAYNKIQQEQETMIFKSANNIEDAVRVLNSVESPFRWVAKDGLVYRGKKK